MKLIIGVMSSSIFIMLLGFFMGRTNKLKSSFSTQLSEIVLCVSIPALSFNAFMKNFNIEIFRNGINILIWAFIIHIIFIFIGDMFYFKYNDTQRITLKMMSVFGGITVFGIPIVQAIYGDEGIIYATIFSIPYRVLLYSYGYIKMSGMKMNRKNINSMIFNPVIVATFLGLFIWIFQKYLPTVEIDGEMFPILRIDKTAIWLYKPFSFLANLCSPLAWLATGLKLSDASIKKSVQSFTSWYFSIIKTLIFPILTLLIILFFNKMNILPISKIGLEVMVIMMGTPTASVIIAYSFKFDKEAIITSKCSFLSTILSLITIPMLIYMIK